MKKKKASKKSPELATQSIIDVGQERVQSVMVSRADVKSSATPDPLLAKAEVRRVGLKEMKDFIKRSTLELEGIDHEQIARVRQMHDRFSEGAQLSFNYNTLLLVASALAGLGLAADSTTTVIASMLVSPIMGPVVGVAYGLTISDRKLVHDALKTELLSLIFCIIVGIVIGGIAGWTDMASNWPSSEMLGRCTWENFFVGLPIAFFSGLGVAVGLLDEQTNSLVGVAISASLLPPAVNSGMVWIAYSYFDHHRYDVAANYDILDEDIESVTRSLFRRGGGISLFLTIANIILVIISSMFMFRLKERLPIKKKVFWEDLRVARKIYQNRAYLKALDDEDEANKDDESSGELLRAESKPPQREMK